MSLPAPDDPPMIETIKLGVIAMHLVIRFLNHFFIFRSKKPCKIITRSLNSTLVNSLMSQKK